MRAMEQLREQDTRLESRHQPWDSHAARALSVVNELASTGASGHDAIKDKLRRVIKDCWNEARSEKVLQLHHQHD